MVFSLCNPGIAGKRETLTTVYLNKGYFFNFFPPSFFLMHYSHDFCLRNDLKNNRGERRGNGMAFMTGAMAFGVFAVAFVSDTAVAASSLMVVVGLPLTRLSHFNEETICFTSLKCVDSLLLMHLFETFFPFFPFFP
jgi:hypothetical protein